MSRGNAKNPHAHDISARIFPTRLDHVAVHVERLVDGERSKYVRHRDRECVDGESLPRTRSSSETEESIGFRHVRVELSVGGEKPVGIEFVGAPIHPFIVVHSPEGVN